ncbi:hypothetical protein MP228_006872 [Amoeboaphelidium protococcarum]|nr:hypothetical protein MP228_006872 [Amoeboaphelidium protococcarum]
MQHYDVVFWDCGINYAQYQDDIASDFENPLHRPSRLYAYWFVYLPLVSYGFIQYLNQKAVKPFSLLPVCSSKIKLVTVTSGILDRTILPGLTMATLSEKVPEYKNAQMVGLKAYGVVLLQCKLQEFVLSTTSFRMTSRMELKIELLECQVNGSTTFVTCKKDWLIDYVEEPGLCHTADAANRVAIVGKGRMFLEYDVAGNKSYVMAYEVWYSPMFGYNLFPVNKSSKTKEMSAFFDNGQVIVKNQNEALPQVNCRTMETWRISL